MRLGRSAAWRELRDDEFYLGALLDGLSLAIAFDRNVEFEEVRSELDVTEGGLDLRLRADGFGEDVTHRRRLRVLGRERDGIDGGLNDRIVAGELNELSVAREVRARIADMRDPRDVAAHVCDRERRPRPVEIELADVRAISQ